MILRLKSLLAAITLVGVLLLAVAAASPSGHSAEVPAKHVSKEFAGKVVTVYLADPHRDCDV